MTELAPVLDWRLAVAAAAILASGFVRGFVGFGAALLSVPIYAWLYGPLVAIPVSTVVGLASTVFLLPTAVRDSERAVVLPICAGVVVFAPLGASVLVVLDPALLRVAISALVVMMTVAMLRGWRLEGRVHGGILLGAGAAGGLIQGSAGVGGPPVVAVALSRPGPPGQQRANVVGVMTAVSLASVPPLAWYGLYTFEVVAIGLLLAPLNYVATWVGARYFSGPGKARFRGAALGGLAAIGLATLAGAVYDLLAAG